MGFIIIQIEFEIMNIHCCYRTEVGRDIPEREISENDENGSKTLIQKYLYFGLVKSYDS